MCETELAPSALGRRAAEQVTMHLLPGGTFSLSAWRNSPSISGFSRLYIRHRTDKIHKRRSPMKGEKLEQWRQLCELAAIEQDPEPLLALVKEINRFAR